MLPRLFAPTKLPDPGTNKTKIMEICSFFLHYILSLPNNQAFGILYPARKNFSAFFRKNRKNPLTNPLGSAKIVPVVGQPSCPADHTWTGIEVVITGLTRNQLTGNRPWVRIPPTPPFYEVFAKCKNLVFLWELTKSLWELINLQLLQEC